nr:hypothetical protein [Burkholderia multivorans]
MAEPTTSTAAVGALLWKLLPGAIGSLIALGFIGEGLTRKQKVVSFLSGGAGKAGVRAVQMYEARREQRNQKSNGDR